MTHTEEPLYNSTHHHARPDKTMQWFEESRNSWKAKAQKAKESLKKQNQEVKRAREARERYKELARKAECQARKEREAKDQEIERLKQELEEANKKIANLQKKDLMPQTGKPRGHTYWNSCITLVLVVMSSACLSFTGMSKTATIFRDLEKIELAPSVETCIQWEMKWGLYKLTRPKERADDWIWLMDHVVSKGVHKCLVVLGVRMSTLREKKDLTLAHTDVEPLGIVPMKTSNGELVQIELESILQACNGIPPLAILKDQGSDLTCGGRNFCEAYPGVINLNDVPHKIALLYEHLLDDDDTWQQFTKKCADFKKQVQLTMFSVIAPPNQRSKARWHNIDVLIDWANYYIITFDQLPADCKEKLKWLLEYQSHIEYWNQLVILGRTGRDFVRKEGLYLDCFEQLEDKIISLDLNVLNSQVEDFTTDLIDIFSEEGNKIPEDKKIIGSTEILESLFGKHKNISERGPKPMGRLILSMAGRTGEAPTESLVQAAFENIREKDVDLWLKNSFC